VVFERNLDLVVPYRDWDNLPDESSEEEDLRLDLRNSAFALALRELASSLKPHGYAIELPR
jgi:hypothetical protein